MNDLGLKQAFVLVGVQQPFVRTPEGLHIFLDVLRKMKPTDEYNSLVDTSKPFSEKLVEEQRLKANGAETRAAFLKASEIVRSANALARPNCTQKAFRKTF